VVVAEQAQLVVMGHLVLVATAGMAQLHQLQG
jgi:hypothetical protein